MNREERSQFLQELRISEAHGLMLMKRISQHTVCSTGSVIHFDPVCPFFSKGKPFPYCSRCMNGGAVSESHGM